MKKGSSDYGSRTALIQRTAPDSFARTSKRSRDTPLRPPDRVRFALARPDRHAREYSRKAFGEPFHRRPLAGVMAREDQSDAEFARLQARVEPGFACQQRLAAVARRVGQELRGRAAGDGQVVHLERRIADVLEMLDGKPFSNAMEKGFEGEWGRKRTEAASSRGWRIRRVITR